MRLRRLIGVTSVAVCVTAVMLLGRAPLAQAPANRFDALAAFAEAKMREYRVPGVALGIIDNGVVTTRGLGVTNVEDPLPVNDHTVFPIASISKTFAATAMMRLVEQGKVDLKAPVRKYLPEFRSRSDEAASRDVTVWNLLTHTPGWEGQVSGPERGEDTLRNFVATVMPDLMQVAPPAAAWSYNNAGFSVSGPRHRSGDRHVDQSRDARPGLHAARPRARRHHRRRLHRQSLCRGPREPRRRAAGR